MSSPTSISWLNRPGSRRARWGRFDVLVTGDDKLAGVVAEPTDVELSVARAVSGVDVGV
jgi:hypothetical protein